MPVEHSHTQDGFTLIELLVCLVIISVMSAAVVMTLSPEEEPVHATSEQFLVRVNSAAQQSVITGVPAAFGLSQSAYGIYGYDSKDGQWHLSSEVQFPDDVRVRFIKDETEIKLLLDLTVLAVFEPTGLGPDFTLTLQSGDETIALRSRGDGRVARVAQ